MKITPLTSHFLQALLISLLSVFLIYCFKFNIDLSDEGFYLYYFQKGYNAVSINFYHVLISPIGYLFDHHLYIYRLMSLFGILGSSLFLYYSFKVYKSHPKTSLENNLWLTPVTLGLLYFHLIATFSYNLLVMIGLTSILGLLFLIKNSSKKSLLACCMGLILFVVFSARFATGIVALVIVTLSFFCLFSERKMALRLSFWTILTFLISLFCYIFLFKDHFLKTMEVVKALSQSSHSNLPEKYVRNLFDFLFKSVIPPLIVFILSRIDRLKSRVLWVLYFLWHFGNHLILNYNFPKFSYYLSGFLLAHVVYQTISSYKSKSLSSIKIFEMYTPLAFFFIAPLGTNNNLFKSTSYGAILLYPLICERMRSSGERIFVNLLLIICCAFGIYRHQFFQTYASRPRSEITYTVGRYPSISGLMIDIEIEKKLSAFMTSLEKSGFRKDKDKVFVYPNMPGMAAYLGLSSHGNPWNIDLYPNSHIYNCSFMKLEKLNPGLNVYVYLEKKLDLKTKECLPLDRSIFLSKIFL